MEPRTIAQLYVLYIGAGAVAAGGIISLFQALPLILSLDSAPACATCAAAAATAPAAHAPIATCRWRSSASASLVLVAGDLGDVAVRTHVLGSLGARSATCTCSAPC